ncbi:MAG: CobB/CobQ domain protein glutamine amidotransferase [Blastococcus sp.]|nr:CobB/CobQ domain protein glutamine amidotransferase [Blastococcus sp.]
MSGESAVRIGALLPDVLNTYSDGGNVTVLAQRLRWRGVPVEISTVTVDMVPPVGCDLYVLGGGEDAAQVFAADWLRRHRHLCAALAENAMTLAVCAGLQVLGGWMEDSHGRRHAGAEILDLTTERGCRRAVGEVVTWCALPDVGALTGFENHRGATALGPGTAPLGRVLRGTGNETAGRGEGVLTDHIVGTYLHGPVLARNPALADALLHAVTGRALQPLDLPDQAAVRADRLSPRRRWPGLLTPERAGESIARIREHRSRRYREEAPHGIARDRRQGPGRHDDGG